MRNRFVRSARPNMWFLLPKTIGQQDVQNLHRVRSRLISSRTALVNQIYGLLAEYGLVLAQQVGTVQQNLPNRLKDGSNGTPLGRATFQEFYEEFCALDQRIRQLFYFRYGSGVLPMSPAN